MKTLTLMALTVGVLNFATSHLAFSVGKRNLADLCYYLACLQMAFVYLLLGYAVWP